LACIPIALRCLQRCYAFKKIWNLSPLNEQRFGTNELRACSRRNSRSPLK
jgi:hypothetical protein